MTMMLNPDPKKYVIRFRKGKPVLVDRQILRWRERRSKSNPKTPLDAQNCPINNFVDSDSTEGATDAKELLKKSLF